MDFPNLGAWGVVIGIVAIALIWLLIVRPSERRHQQRRLDMIHEKMERLEKCKQKQSAENCSEGQNKE